MLLPNDKVVDVSAQFRRFFVCGAVSYGLVFLSNIAQWYNAAILKSKEVEVAARCPNNIGLLWVFVVWVAGFIIRFGGAADICSAHEGDLLHSSGVFMLWYIFLQLGFTVLVLCCLALVVMATRAA